MELCRAALTYERGGISAMLDDVTLDVGKAVNAVFSTSIYETVILSTRDAGRKLKVSNMLRIRLILVFN